MQIFFIQSRVYWFTVVAILASIAMWFITMFIVDSNVEFSFFDFYGVFTMVTANGSYWLTTILLVSLLTGKDAYICALERSFNFKNFQIIQEVEAKPGTSGIRALMGGRKVTDSKAISLVNQTHDSDVTFGGQA